MSTTVVRTRETTSQSLVEVGLVALLLTALAIWWTWPVALSPASSVFGLPGDSTGSIYDLWYARHFGASLIFEGRNELLAFPTGMTSGGLLLIPGLILFVPGVVLTYLVNEILAYNILVLAGIVGPGCMAFVLFRNMVKSRLVSLFASLFFVLLPYHQLSLLQWYGQSQLLGMPLTALLCLRVLQQPNVRNSWMLAAGVGISFLMNPYVGLMAGVLALGVGIVALITYRRALLEMLSRLTKKSFALLLSSLAVLSMLLLIVILRVQETISRPTAELLVYGLRLEHVLRPTAYSLPAIGRQVVPPVKDFHGSNLVEVSQYIGLTLVVLAAADLVRAAFRRRVTFDARVGLVAICGGLLVGVTNWTLLGLDSPWSPAILVSKVAPFWRVYSRFGLLVGLGCLILAGLFLDALVSAIDKRWIGHLIVITISVVVLADLWVSSPGAVIKPYKPAYVDFLSSQQTGPTVEYPLARSNDHLRYERRLRQRSLKVPSLNGDYATDDRLARLGAEDIQVTTAGDVLASLGAKWIVIDDDEYRRVGLTPPIVPSSTGLLRFESENVRIFELMRKSDDGVAWLEEGAFPPESINSISGQWMGDKATVLVARSGKGCAQLSLSLTLYEGIRDVEVRTGTSVKKVTGGGEVIVPLPSFENTTYVHLRSNPKALQIPGEDPRSVSAWVDSDMVVTTVECPD